MSTKELAKKIVGAMGGIENITQSWHCITRLRFNFKDKTRINDDEIKQLEGVLGSQFQSGQYQIIIGAEVNNVYAELSELLGDSSEWESKGTASKGNILEIIFDVISGIFTPLLPAITGGGLLKGVMALMVALKMMTEGSQNYQILNFIADAPFHFLPFLIAFSAAKKFKTEPSLAVALAGTLMYPQMMEYAAGGEITHLNFMSLPIPMNSYASTVMPVILGVWVMSYINKYMTKLVPKSLKIIFVPLLTMVITAPIVLMLIAPLGNYMGVYLATFFTMLFHVAGPFAGLLLGGLMPLIVITGMHYAFFPSIFASLDKLGYEVMVLPMNFVANIAQAGAVMGVLLKSKDKKMKQLAFSTLLPALFGITEPAIYGVTMKLKKPFYASLVGGAVGGAIFGTFNVKAFAFSVPGIMSLPTYLEKGTHNFMFAVIGVAASFIVSLVVSLLLKYDIEESKEDSKTTIKPLVQKDSIDIMSPLKGDVLDLELVPDATFSDGLVGKGIAIMPSEGTVYAPFNGSVTMLTPTNHAIGLTSDEGVELLIHVGLETVNLNGDGFNLLVKEGQRITLGEKLIDFDIDKLLEKGINLMSPVVVTNSTKYLDVLPLASGEVENGTSKVLKLIN